MTSEQTFVIVGASLAGAKAAETLRTEGFDGRLVLIGIEHERPYERPPLSKDYLRGEVGREKVYLHDEGFYAEHEIELLLGRTAVSLETSVGQVALDDGKRLRYDRLLLATGAEPRGLPIPAASWRACCTCAASRTPTRCASGSTAAALSWSWAPAGSAPRSPRLPGSAASM
jgi:3-phenylpropionate/trans-cinnamate dioxygenase ferredoxin reductase subunit